MVTSYSQVRPVTREVRFFYEGQSKTCTHCWYCIIC
nr:MAG TPA: hypothetical protein [Caudoviricetes sp.]